MEEEALSMIRATFDKHEISEEEFHTCVFALLQSQRLETWKNLVKTAYRRLSKPVNDQVRSAMLNYYFSVGEAARAFEFFPHRPTKFFDAWTMMQVCLELGRLDEAKKVARYCSGFLATADDDFTRASMADALASYCLSDWRPRIGAQALARRSSGADVSASKVLRDCEGAAAPGSGGGQSRPRDPCRAKLGPIPVARFGCQVTPQLQSVTQNAS